MLASTAELPGQVEVIHSQRKGLEERIAALHGEMFAGDRIVTIPGVGPTVAGVVRAVVANLERFANLAAFRGYTGLVPREDSSGETRRRGGSPRPCRRRCAGRCTWRPTLPVSGIRSWPSFIAG